VTPVFEWPDAPSFAAALADPRFLPAVVVSALAGAVRGFSGFGSALIYIPLVAAIYEPRTAAVTLLLIDLVSSLPFTITAFARCNWREVTPVATAMAIAVPFGTMILLFVDPVILRWVIAALVIGLLMVLISGWRYHGPPHLAASLGVGAVAGLGAGAVQIAGPPVIAYWLGGPAAAATVRANLMVFFALSGTATTISYALQGLFTRPALTLAVLLGAPFLAAMTLGALMFRGASETTYRRVAYGLIAVSALVSLPLFDRLLR
jgi:uncharacterized protein